MAAVYFPDSSALAKRYVAETGSAWLQSTLAPSTGSTVFVARITGAELIAALTRRERGNTLSGVDATTARTAFRTHLKTEYKVIEITEALIEHAMSLAEIYGLRGYDSVQLAAAKEVNNRYLAAGLPSVTLLSADSELNAAAVAEGLTVDNPNNHP